MTSATSLAIGMILAAACLAAALAWYVREHVDTLREARDRVQHTHAVLLAVKDLDISLREAERVQRGFLATGSPAHLQAYETAASRVWQLHAELVPYTVDSAVQSSRVKALEGLLRSEFAQMQADIQARRHDSAALARAAAPAVVATGFMSEIRARLDSIEEAEQRLLDARNRAFSSSEGKVRMAIIQAFLALATALLVTAAIVMRAHRTSQRAAERLSLVLEAGQLGFWDLNLATWQFTLGGAGALMLGFPNTELSMPMSVWMNRVHPDDVATANKAFKDHLDGRAPVFASEHRVRHQDGRWRWILARGRLIERDAAGRPVRALGTHLDVTARREAEVLLRDSETRLREADRRKDQFLATLAHELRNPLAPVRTAAYMLATPQLNAERQRWAGAVIQRQVAHMARLLDDLLDVARITQGKLVVKLAPVQLDEVVQSALEAAQPLIERKGHHLQVELPAEPVQLRADPIRLSQVLQNLLTNAAKYTDEGGAINVRASVASGWLSLEVIDNGIGVDPQAAADLFRMFTQLSHGAERSEGGLGIGLALSRALVEMQGGALEAHSAGLGRGSVFRVRLPLSGRRSEP